MCLSAASQAGYKELAYIIPASRYITQIPWMSDGLAIDKQALSQQFSNPIQLTHLDAYEQEFCEVFEQAMHDLLTPKVHK